MQEGNILRRANKLRSHGALPVSLLYIKYLNKLSRAEVTTVMAMFLQF
jgi:hypothetical protein